MRMQTARRPAVLAAVVAALLSAGGGTAWACHDQVWPGNPAPFGDPQPPWGAQQDPGSHASDVGEKHGGGAGDD